MSERSERVVAVVGRIAALQRELAALEAELAVLVPDTPPPPALVARVARPPALERYNRCRCRECRERGSHESDTC